MKVKLTEIGQTTMEAFAHPRGHFWEFSVPPGGSVTCVVVHGEVKIKPVRREFAMTLSAVPGSPVVVASPGTYRGYASRFSLGVQGVRS